ncbi:MAG: tRNA 2-thiouridine(34) synthase MnmA [Candidatus Veblenbacteria bacterium RIFOXYD1_FULL_43_11]|uniref:tRNA-specific 2-thiouridylase MnmA n=1 Tax=Candidatus Veblenbacteria bacterium RIFOXYD1_FULL_43_11 TaxID=1802429 RepID=A0A1G2Q8A1_9BACT|nr:MAG: tRNA 2-thiouridine(34) synthase MnmA [Candidatus Veblenbacteria bacterium RIFOXYD1_FULL_43_11]
MTKVKVIMALSGGVDSAVSAYLLKKQGYAVHTVFMKNFTGTHDNLAGECNWVRERDDAARVARHLKIPFAVWDFEKQYQRFVIDYFFHEYKRGRTPNPDVRCNQYVKIPLFLIRALKEGADFIATGHYARKSHPTGNHPQGEKNNLWQLLSGTDDKKDQSYFLYTLTQLQLKHLLFPVGEMTKPEVRKLAKRLKLPVAEKPDSQGICFVGEVKIFDFLRTRLPEKPGDLIDTRGRVVGQHRGLWFYTIGQREGLGLSNGPWYVLGRNWRANQLIIGHKNEQRLIMAKSCITSKPHWINKPVKLPAVLLVRHRYRHPAFAAAIKKSGDGLKINFREPQRAITPGQSAVLYKKNKTGLVVLGGAVIDKVEKTKFSW